MTSFFIYKKICSICGEEKPLCDFVHQNGRPQARCRECNNKTAKENYKKSCLPSKSGSPWFTKREVRFTQITIINIKKKN
jgi:hypothetical protein